MAVICDMCGRIIGESDKYPALEFPTYCTMCGRPKPKTENKISLGDRIFFFMIAFLLMLFLGYVAHLRTVWEDREHKIAKLHVLLDNAMSALDNGNEGSRKNTLAEIQEELKCLKEKKPQ